MNNKLRYNDTFINIKKTFQRIVENNKDKNKNELIVIGNNILSSTKEDSLPINEENNKIIKENKNDLEKIVEKNEESSKKMQNNRNVEDNNISVKDILKILNSIETKEINVNKKKKKRKKNEINTLKSDNYIKDLRKMTKKIGYYNYLLDDLQ